MSQPGSEFFSSEQRSTSSSSPVRDANPNPLDNPNPLTTTTTSESLAVEVQVHPEEKDSPSLGSTSTSSSSSVSSSCDFTPSSGTSSSEEVGPGGSSSTSTSTSVINEETDEGEDGGEGTSNSFELAHFPVDSLDADGGHQSPTEHSPGKSATSGNVSSSSSSELGRSSSISSEEGSDSENHCSLQSRRQRHHQQQRQSEAIPVKAEDEEYSSEDFETVYSDEEESNCSAGEEALSNCGGESSSKVDSAGRRQTSYPHSYYNRRLQLGDGHNSTVPGSPESGFQPEENRTIRLIRYLDKIAHRMTVFVGRYHKELCITFLIFASGIASLRSSPAKLRSASEPAPFFEDKDVSYFLQDNYMGEYVELAHKQIPYHPSFLFYYAPWDSESVASRSVFLSVAKHFYFTYHGRVKFYAINCWWPGGQCRKNYKNLSHYPIFVAHIGKAAGIIYNGPIRLQPMVKFINSLLKPVTRIDTEAELWNFRAQHDVIMLGYFNFTQPESNEAYETYLQMALRTFEADPFNQVGFGLFLRPELAEKFFLSTSNAISLVLFNEIHTAKWHGGYHAQGLKGPVSQVAEWIIERTKTVPVTWVYALRNGFANRPAALGPHDFAQQLSHGPVFLLVSRRYFPSGHSPFYMQVKEIALDYFNCNKSGNVTKLRRTSHKINSEWASIWSSVVQICQRKGSFQCQQMMPNIHHWIQKRFLFKRESLLHYENVSAALNFTGLSCNSERQFKFLAIDPVDVPYFINLGLSGLKNADDTKYSIDPMAFIIDSQNDMILPLPSLNITDMAIAIHNYTLATENGDMESISSFAFLNNNGNDAANEGEAHKKEVKEASMLENWGSDDLLQYIKGKSLNDSAFLEDNYGNGSLKVKLIKIAMFKNSLPPELNPEELPTVIFIPGWNRTDVKMYPENKDISSLGLLRFILSELEPNARVQASLMSPSCGPNNKFCTMTQSDHDCRSSNSSGNSVWTKTNSTTVERLSCIKSSRNSVSSQIGLLLERLQNGEEVMFDYAGSSLRPLTTQAWNGQLLDRLRTMAVSLDVS